MRKRQVLIGLGTAAVITLAACGGGGNEAEPSASPSIETTTIEESTQDPSPTTTSEESSPAADDIVTGTPNFEHLEGCNQIPYLPCWLPIHPAPLLVDDLSLTNKWPYEQDSISVVCSVQGQSIQDDRAIPTYTWYKVVVPEDKISIIDDHNAGLTVDELEPAPGGYYGFVSAVWILLEEGAVLEPCS